MFSVSLSCIKDNKLFIIYCMFLISWSYFLKLETFSDKDNENAPTKKNAGEDYKNEVAKVQLWTWKQNHKSKLDHIHRIAEQGLNAGENTPLGFFNKLLKHL